jgi:4-hydroxy-tetrahydrodipicolinate reductase
MIRVALNGANGRMCHVIYDLIQKREDCKVVVGFDINDTPYADFPIYRDRSQYQEPIDVIIDFSHVNGIREVLDYAAPRGIPVVIATTGSNEEQIAYIRSKANEIPLFFTYNMSLGINLLAELAKRAVAVLGDQFDVEIIEKHHNQKIDAPSGTAIMLANAVNEAAEEKYQYVYDRHAYRKKREPNEIGIHSIRGGSIVGEHTILFAGRDETIELTHSAASKEVFAVGAVNAAVFLAGQKPGIYDMKDLLKNS